MTEPVSAESVTDVARRYVLPGIDAIIATPILFYRPITKEQLAAYDERQAALHEALFNVGATYEDADRIGQAYYYGRYGDGD